MLSDICQLDHSVPEYAIFDRIIDDILKKIVDLISVVSSRFSIG
jgi:hypothetical protein